MYFLEYTCIDAPMPTGMPLFWSCLGIIMDLKKRIMFQYLVIVCYHAWKCYNLNQSMSCHALGIFMVLLWFWLYIRFGLLHWLTQYTTKWLCHSPVIMHMPLFFEIYSRAWICLYIHEPTDCWSYYYMMLLSWILITPMRAMLLVLIAYCCLLHYHVSILATVAVWTLSHVYLHTLWLLPRLVSSYDRIHAYFNEPCLTLSCVHTWLFNLFVLIIYVYLCPYIT